MPSSVTAGIVPQAALFSLQVNGAAVFWFSKIAKTNRKPNMKPIIKQIQIQLKGDSDAVNAAIAILHAGNFFNGSIWSNAIRQRGSRVIIRVAAREVEIPVTPPES